MVIVCLYHRNFDDFIESFHFVNRTANDMKPIIVNYCVSSVVIARIVRIVMVWIDIDIELIDRMNKPNSKKDVKFLMITSTLRPDRSNQTTSHQRSNCLLRTHPRQMPIRVCKFPPLQVLPNVKQCVANSRLVFQH